MTNKIRIVLIILIFAGGWILGRSNDVTPIITSSAGGASYSGGYRTALGNDQITVGAVPLRRKEGQIHIVRPNNVNLSLFTSQGHSTNSYLVIA